MRNAIVAGLAAVAGMAGLALGTGLSGSLAAGCVVAVLAAALVGFLASTGRWGVRDDTAASPALLALSALAAVLSVVGLVRLTVFMIGPAPEGYSVLPSSRFELRHCCLTAYYVAGQAAGEAQHIYDDALYSVPHEDKTARREPRLIGPFSVDVYEYPPPFLLLPRAFLLVTHDFMQFRTAWYGLGLGFLLAGIVAVAAALGPAAGTRALLLAPLVFATLPTLGMLQKGNVQGIVIALSMLAMLLLERRHFAWGGALLAFVTLAKLFPGLLVVFLIARRQWRALAWTAAMGVLLLAVSLLDTGFAPFVDFAHHLPGLLGGEAFPAFRVPLAMAINLSIPGLVFKAKLFGVPGMGFPLAKVVGWLWTLFALWATVRLALRARSEADLAIAWLAVLVLAILRSPFLPVAYGVFPALWLLTLLAAIPSPSRRAVTVAVLWWLALAVYLPQDWSDSPRFLALLTLVPQAAMVLLVLVVLRRAPDTADASA
jgi:alpha-1,2-mannosyltransferase